MDESQPPALPENSAPVTTSLISRLTNIFAAPGEVFDEVKASESAVANWIVPLVLMLVLVVASTFLIYSQPAIKQQVLEMQGKEFDKQVAAGKMKAEQAEQIKEAMEKMDPIIFQLIGVAFVAVGTVVGLFFWGLVIWLLGTKALNGDFSYMKSVECVGLATMISLLGSVVTTLMVISLGNVNARPALHMFAGEFDMSNKVHLLLSSVNLFYVWYAVVLAVALGRLSGVSFGKAALWLFGFWIGIRLLLTPLGLGQFFM